MSVQECKHKIGKLLFQAKNHFSTSTLTAEVQLTSGGKLMFRLLDVSLLFTVVKFRPSTEHRVKKLTVNLG